jgi:bifunctional non-homologous end joining protein LigD
MLMRTPHRWVRPKRLQPPGFIVPCQPTLADRVPEGDGWIHELKHDGFRILAFKDGDAVRLWSRNGRDWSGEFVAITEAMRELPFKRVMFDGEAVAHCLDGLPDFHRLLGDGQATACFYAFDLLWLEAQDVRGVELIGRRRMLQKALRKAGEALRCGGGGRPGDVPARLQDGPGGDRVEARGESLSLRPVPKLGEGGQSGV